MPDRRVLAACSLYHLANDAAVTVTPALFPVLRTALGFGYAEVGLLTATGLAVTVAFQFVFGALADRADRRVLLPLGVAWLGVGTLLLSTATSYGTLVLFVALARIGASAYHPAGISWVAREFRGAGVDRAMGVQSSFGDLGVLLGLLPAGLLAVVWGWRGTFLFWGALNLAAAGAGFALTAKTGSRGEQADGPRSPVLPVLRGVAPWILPLAAGGAAFTITVSYGPLLLTDRLRLSAAAADVVVGLWIVTGSLAAFSFGRISRRFGRFPALLYAYLAVAVAGVMIATATALWGVVLGLVAFNALLFITYPALFSFVADAGDARSQGVAFGLLFGFQLVGGALAAYASGLLAAATGRPEMPFHVLAFIALATFVYLFVLRAVRDDRASPGLPSGPSP